MFRKSKFKLLEDKMSFKKNAYDPMVCENEYLLLTVNPIGKIHRVGASVWCLSTNTQHRDWKYYNEYEEPEQNKNDEPEEEEEDEE